MAPKESKSKPTKKSHSNSKQKISKPQQRKPASSTSQSQPPKRQPPPLPTTTPSGKLPLNWPSPLPYLTHPLFSPLLTPSHLTALRTRPPPDSVEPLDELPPDYVPGPCTKAVIRPITDKRHPACGQAGLFAASDLKPGEFVVRYLGEVHPGEMEWGGGLVFPREEGEEEGDDGDKTGESGKDEDVTDGKAEEDGKQEVDKLPQTEEEKPASSPPAEEKYNYKLSDYDLWLDHPSDLAIDACRSGNEARFVNDYRGIPNPAYPPGYVPQSKKEELFLKRPNAEFKVVWDPVRQEKTMAVYVLPAGKKATGKAREVGIERGKEVVVSYGKGFWEKRREEEERKKQEEEEGGGVDEGYS